MVFHFSNVLKGGNPRFAGETPDIVNSFRKIILPFHLRRECRVIWSYTRINKKKMLFTFISRWKASLTVSKREAAFQRERGAAKIQKIHEECTNILNLAQMSDHGARPGNTVAKKWDKNNNGWVL